MSEKPIPQEELQSNAMVQFLFGYVKEKVVPDLAPMKEGENSFSFSLDVKGQMLRLWV